RATKSYDECKALQEEHHLRLSSGVFARDKAVRGTPGRHQTATSERKKEAFHVGQFTGTFTFRENRT
ncbi:MAG TPA: hypothetical protein PLZ24_15915, partial [Flavobacteriales bacterium]|nr:hypothetical protein [Flavobacteriales bacterium]